ncbi:Mn-dependent transcriptional regulator MntR [Streptococcus criceti]|uniref:Manganese transport regulator n=1 Tax=Streptococcus criceti HS-6 TaxID=873449 RepID=G5JTF9_STRCG|nr:metal-dependent transcriptional regulator [Streptococcus criceti]EHI74697.1 iron-dependent transcriptional regulator [Streptococcus criceti HS-6]SUN43594.1 Mn-dependent transcriptional regulator MntR [Streptococcus criceti]
MTPNREDYLKCIYELGQIHHRMTNKEIAEKMQVSAPAVSEMVKKMISEKLITKDKVSGYRLSQKGLLLVSDLYRKHRLIESFLVRDLHYTPDEIHQEAEVLEHTVSTIFIDRLEENLGFPEYCPHGGSIPKKGEILEERYRIPLSQIDKTGFYLIGRARDNFQLLNYLDDHRLHINQSIELTAIDNYAQTFTIHYNGEELVIPKIIAQEIYVRALK